MLIDCLARADAPSKIARTEYRTACVFSFLDVVENRDFCTFEPHQYSSTAMKSGDFTRLLETEVSFWMLESIIQRHGQLGRSGGTAASSQRRHQEVQWSSILKFVPAAQKRMLEVNPGQPGDEKRNKSGDRVCGNKLPGRSIRKQTFPEERLLQYAPHHESGTRQYETRPISASQWVLAITAIGHVGCAIADTRTRP